jgi:hypothetical protein
MCCAVSVRSGKVPSTHAMLGTDTECRSKIITGDEMWVYRCDQKPSKSRWKSPSSPCPREAKQVCSNVTSKLTGFLTFIELYYEFVPQRQTVS